jgi:hypothetical protein
MTEGIEPAIAPIAAPKAKNTVVTAMRGENEDRILNISERLARAMFEWNHPFVHGSAAKPGCASELFSKSG